MHNYFRRDVEIKVKLCKKYFPLKYMLLIISLFLELN